MTKNELTLSSGHAMPIVGFGTWKADRGVVAKAVADAIGAGYRLIDAAAVYENEAEVGAGIRDGLTAANGAVTRADLFVTSKLWNTDHEPARVEEACRRTLADLGLEYLDLYLVHFPLAMAYSPPAEGEGGARFLDAAPTAAPPPAVGLQDTWRAMEALVAKGLVRSIGVSNYSAALLVDLVRYAKVQPAVNQVEIHPYLAQPRLVAWCQAHNIHVTAYSSLGSISYAKFDHFDFKGPFLLEHPAVAEIAAEHGKTAAQVLLRWAVQRGIAVIPKSTNAGRIAENADVVDWALSDSAMATLNGLDANRRFNNMVDLFWDAPIWS